MLVFITMGEGPFSWSFLLLGYSLDKKKNVIRRIETKIFNELLSRINSPLNRHLKMEGVT